MRIDLDSMPGDQEGCVAFLHKFFDFSIRYDIAHSISVIASLGYVEEAKSIVFDLVERGYINQVLSDDSGVIEVSDSSGLADFIEEPKGEIINLDDSAARGVAEATRDAITAGSKDYTEQGGSIGIFPEASESSGNEEAGIQKRTPDDSVAGKDSEREQDVITTVSMRSKEGGSSVGTPQGDSDSRSKKESDIAVQLRDMDSDSNQVLRYFYDNPGDRADDAASVLSFTVSKINSTLSRNLTGFVKRTVGGGWECYSWVSRFSDLLD